jgi:GNAT superfamily N-acetyltransferase
MYRREMSRQIVHDSIHERPGWSAEYLLSVEGVPAGYGSVATGGPWATQPSIYEFYAEPAQRLRLFDLFEALLEASGALRIEIQSNDLLALVLLHAYGHDIASESILFEDHSRTTYTLEGVRFRHPSESEAPDLSEHQRRWRGVIEVDGAPAATGGVLFHYNPPYGDIYMEVDAPFRRRGVGTFLVQELKRLCYEAGRIPAARCSPANLASRRTLQRAGFAPCGHILTATVAPRVNSSSR